MSYLRRGMGDLFDDATVAIKNPGPSVPDPDFPTFTPPLSPEQTSSPFQVTQQYGVPPAPNVSSGGGYSGGGGTGGAFDFSILAQKFPGLLRSSSGAISPIAIGALAVGAILVYKAATKKQRRNPARRRR